MGLIVPRDHIARSFFVVVVVKNSKSPKNVHSLLYSSGSLAELVNT